MATSYSRRRLRLRLPPLHHRPRPPNALGSTAAEPLTKATGDGLHQPAAFHSAIPRAVINQDAFGVVDSTKGLPFPELITTATTLRSQAAMTPVTNLSIIPATDRANSFITVPATDRANSSITVPAPDHVTHPHSIVASDEASVHDRTNDVCAQDMAISGKSSLYRLATVCQAFPHLRALLPLFHEAGTSLDRQARAEALLAFPLLAEFAQGAVEELQMPLAMGPSIAPPLSLGAETSLTHAKSSAA